VRALLSRAVVLGVLVASVAAAPRAAAATPEGMLAGIDVSHWQGTIDWAKVAGDGVRFAIMKATEGRSYVDPTYSKNVVGAAANGITVGAYHFAGPSSQKGDAKAEADHFVSVARNAAGDVLPALDIEHTGGLSAGELQDWVRAWLEEVTSKLGVRPMIYTSPGFWTYSMGNTQWFAVHGYTTLWVAHWGVHRPTVPANNWAGHGWTFWQWTDCWHVRGIGGCVDGDRFNGTDLVGGTIGRLTVTPTPGGTVTGSDVDCGGGGTTCSRLANPGEQLDLTATPDPGASVMGWTGACAAGGSATDCTVTVNGLRKTSATFGYPIQVTKEGTGDGTVSADPEGISCGSTCSSLYPVGSTVTLSAAADSASGFGAWSGDCVGSLPTCELDVGAPRDIGASFDAATPLADDAPGTNFSWGKVSDRRAIGGAYLVEHRAGASASFPFTGSSVTWYTIEAPSMGRADVSIDETSIGTFNGYRRSFHADVPHRFTGLGAGSHTITITALGTKSTAAAGTRVVVDAIRSGGELRSNAASATGTWSRVTDANADGGGYLVSDQPEAAASLGFTGTGVSFTTVLGPQMGKAQIWIDGKLVRTVDLSATSVSYGAVRTVSGFADREHVVRVVVLGKPGAHGTGHAVAVDGWIVR